MKVKALALLFGLAVVLIGIVSVAPSTVSYSPVDVEVTNVNARSFSVEWTSVSDEEGRLDWKETEIISPICVIEKEGSSSTLHNMLITGLEENTAHSFTIWSNGIEYGDSDGDGNPATGYAKENAPAWRVATPTITPEDTYVFGHVLAEDAPEASIVKILLECRIYEGTVDSNGNFAIGVGGAQGSGIIWFEDALGSVLYYSDTTVSDSPQDLGEYDLRAKQEDPGARVAEAARDVASKEVCGPTYIEDISDVSQDEVSSDVNEDDAPQRELFVPSTNDIVGSEDTAVSGGSVTDILTSSTEKLVIFENDISDVDISGDWPAMEYAINGEDIVDFSNSENRQYLGDGSGSYPTFSSYSINGASQIDNCDLAATLVTVTY